MSYALGSLATGLGIAHLRSLGLGRVEGLGAALLIAVCLFIAMVFIDPFLGWKDDGP